jgi:phage-related holin
MNGNRSINAVVIGLISWSIFILVVLIARQPLFEIVDAQLLNASPQSKQAFAGWKNIIDLLIVVAIALPPFAVFAWLFSQLHGPNQ